jgi:gas vesicle protein
MNKFLITVLAGVAIGILIAPAKGSETRKKIQKTLDELANELNKFIESEKRLFSNAVNNINEVK